MNNEVEGWQNRLNRKTLTWKLVMYLYCTQKHSLSTSRWSWSTSVDKWRTYQNVQGCLHDYWHRYTTGDLTMAQLLSRCSLVMGPSYT